MEALYDLGLPPDISTHGGGIDDLINILHIIMVLMFVGWGIFMTYCLVKYRARPGHKAQYKPIKAKLSKAFEIVIVVIEMVLLIGLAMPVWSDYRNMSAEEEAEEEFRIRVVAQQFAWNFQYPGADGIFGDISPEYVTEGTPRQLIGLDPNDPNGFDDIIPPQNSLVLPMDKKIIVEITSRDVIHSFAINVLRVKQDAIPGMRIPIWFKIDGEKYEQVISDLEETTGYERSFGDTYFDIACAQLCGLSHYTMQGYLRVRTPEEFEAWMAAEVARLGISIE